MNFNDTRQKTKPGFSFIELMIAMVILFLAVMVVGSIFPVSFKSLLKSKQVTVATTLAQQKLEQCLVNPKDYKTRVGEEGNFSPEHPEYSYNIKETPVTNKLNELKVEVYKLVNGGKIVDAAVAQLVQSGEMKVYKVYKDTDVPIGLGSWVTCLTKSIDIPEDGIIKIDAKGQMFGSSYTPHGANFMIKISCDGVDMPGSINSGTGFRSAFGSTTAALKITKGTHIIRLIAYCGGTDTTDNRICYPSMIITYMPINQENYYEGPGE